MRNRQDKARCAKELTESRRPLIYFGNGVRRGFAHVLAQRLTEESDLPFVVSWSAIDLFDDDHRLNQGRVGIYGDRAANILIQKSDFLLCVGTRLAIPQIGYSQEDFARKAKRWVVDIDESELSKFQGPRWSLIQDDAASFLEYLTRFLQSEKMPDISSWLDECSNLWQKLPREKQGEQQDLSVKGFIHSSSVMQHLNSVLPDRAVVVTDVGAGLLAGHYTLTPKKGQRLFTSQGLGEMGFGLPGALGAFFADKKRPLICLNTDGGLMFNIQELQTFAYHKIPLKLFVFNNDGYAMIKISQANLFDGRISGVDSATGLSFPKFDAIARAFNFSFRLVTDSLSLEREVEPALNSNNAELIEIRMNPDQAYLPRLWTTKHSDGGLTSPPLEDLHPLLSLSDLESLLGYRAHPASYEARGVPYQ